MDLILSGGTVVTAGDTFAADIGIEGGRIVRIGFDLGPAAREIDVSGLYLLPGAVDVHTHVDV
ncbi:MAG: dihydropyrimidinase, partial [Rhodospirillales bacterium]|nr:dihydropyrimidinase [Rhodospirillales bacterium]